MRFEAPHIILQQIISMIFVMDNHIASIPLVKSTAVQLAHVVLQYTQRPVSHILDPQVFSHLYHAPSVILLREASRGSTIYVRSSSPM